MNQSVSEKYDYDVAIVLGGGVYSAGGHFYPTEYTHSDEFGMLGGSVRIDAALALYLQGKASNFLFSTGISAKQLAMHGPTLPPGAKVYSEAFLQRLRAAEKAPSLKPPNIFLEGVSKNTVSNLLEITQIIRREGWSKAAIISSDYHVPRIRALFTQLQEDSVPKLRCDVAFLSAEQILRKAYPGVYDAKIASAYATDAARKRLKNEKQGLDDIKAGRYVRTEYQSHASYRQK